MNQSGGPDWVQGAAFGFAAVSIWPGWSVVTRLAVTTGLDGWDVAALRFGVAGVLLAPVVVSRGFAIDRLGWSGLAVIIAGVGAPYVLVAAYGLRFAPAYDQGALNPGCMPLFVALLAAAVLREAVSIPQKFGLLLILAGAVLVVGCRGAGWDTSRLVGDALFLLASLLTAGFTVIMRRAKLDPLHAVALVSSGSLVILLPVYLLRCGIRITRLPLVEIIVQAVFQGILVTIVSLLLYGRAVAILGASAAAAFGALVPVLSALYAMPLLGEWPDLPNWVGIILISTGAWQASGRPSPQWNLRDRHP